MKRFGLNLIIFLLITSLSTSVFSGLIVNADETEFKITDVKKESNKVFQQVTLSMYNPTKTTKNLRFNDTITYKNKWNSLITDFPKEVANNGVNYDVEGETDVDYDVRCQTAGGNTCFVILVGKFDDHSWKAYKQTPGEDPEEGWGWSINYVEQKIYTCQVKGDATDRDPPNPCGGYIWNTDEYT